MGNTNLPQAGAADTANSRDTLSGDSQLTAQQNEDGRDEKDIGPSPGRPKNAPKRVPGQQRGPGGADQKNGHERKRDIERPAHDDRANGGRADTGHSPSDAT